MVFDSLAELLDYACRDRYITEDARRLYKPGEVSEKTGLQKKEDGSWGPVENRKSAHTNGGNVPGKNKAKPGLTKETKIKIKSKKPEKGDLFVTSKTEPKGIQSKMNRRKTYSVKRLKDANNGMPAGYGLDQAPAADYELNLSNGKPAKAYKTVREIDKFLRPRALNYFNKLKPDETGVISFFTYEGDKHMNGALRGWSPMTPKVKQCIETMDRVFKNAPELGEDIVTFRYGAPSELGNLLKDEELSKISEVLSSNRKELKRLLEKHVGDEFVNPAFVSTNVDQEKVSDSEFVFRIKNKKEEKALYISPLADEKYAKPGVENIMGNYENELLLNRCQKFKICAIHNEGRRTRFVVDLEVL